MIARARNERGFTSLELIITISIAMIISLAAFSLIEVTMRRTGEITSRVETLQRGRGALDLMTRQLRSQVCVHRADIATMVSARSIEAGTATSVTFYAESGDPSNIAGAPATVVPPPARRSLSLEGKTIVERRYSGTVAASDATKYTYTDGTPESTRTLVDNVVQYKTTPTAVPTALFRYFAYDTQVPPQPKLELLPLPALTAAQLQQVARIQISYRAKPTVPYKDNTASTVFVNDVSMRTVDANAEINELRNPCL